MIGALSSAAGLATLSLLLTLTASGDVRQLAAATVFAALFAQQAITPILFDLLWPTLTQFDAMLVGSVVKLTISGANWQGNIISAGDHAGSRWSPAAARFATFRSRRCKLKSRRSSISSGPAKGRPCSMWRITTWTARRSNICMTRAKPQRPSAFTLASSTVTEMLAVHPQGVDLSRLAALPRNTEPTGHSGNPMLAWQSTVRICSTSELEHVSAGLNRGDSP